MARGGRLVAAAVLAAGVGASAASEAPTAPPRAGAAVALPATSAPAPAAMRVQRVSPRCHYVQGEAALGSPANRNFISNAGFVVTDTSVVVIDALGSPALARELLTQIRARTGLPVSHVVVTHYHADHVYGLQVFKDAGATIVAHRGGQAYLRSETARLRLEASRTELAPWVDADTRLVEADRWLDGPTELEVGGVRLRIEPAGPAHTAEDLLVHVPAERVLFAGDLVFRGRIPFVGQADSRQWIAALERLLTADVDVIVSGHGPASTRPREDLALTRDYLVHLRRAMGEAARNLEPFEEAYRKADWSRFEKLPLFRAANRMNAYNTYLLLERE